MERVGSDYYFVPQEVAFGDIITKGLCSYVDDAILYQTNDTMHCSQPYTYDIKSHSTMECKVLPNPVASVGDNAEEWQRFDQEDYQNEIE